MEIMLVVVLITSIWVYFDASSIGVKKGQITGVCDMGPWGWFFACVGLWIISFPAYLAKRPQYKRIKASTMPPPPVPIAVVTAPKSNSDDFEQQLIKLARLRDSGVLSEEEFTAKKKAILDL